MCTLSRPQAAAGGGGCGPLRAIAGGAGGQLRAIAGGGGGYSASTLTTMASWVDLAITTTASALPGFSSR